MGFQQSQASQHRSPTSNCWKHHQGAWHTSWEAAGGPRHLNRQSTTGPYRPVKMPQGGSSLVEKAHVSLWSAVLAQGCPASAGGAVAEVFLQTPWAWLLPKTVSNSPLLGTASPSSSSTYSSLSLSFSLPPFSLMRDPIHTWVSRRNRNSNN